MLFFQKIERNSFKWTNEILFPVNALNITRMKILSITKRPVYPLIIGGAEISQHDILDFFAAQGHEILSAGVFTSECFNVLPQTTLVSFYIESVSLFGQNIDMAYLQVKLRENYQVSFYCGSDFLGWTSRLLLSYAPDIVFSQLDGYTEVARAVEDRTPIIHFIRDLINPENFVPYISSWLEPSPTLIVANSYFTAKEMNRLFGVNAIVLYPVINSKMNVTSFENQFGDSVVLLNSSQSKGGEIVLEVARKYPCLKFLVGAGWNVSPSVEFKKLTNVEVLDSMVSPHLLFNKAQLVIVPSQIPECFGRVAVEAQACGLPVIASKIGALPEVLGNSAVLVDDFSNPDAWGQIIEQTISNRSKMKSLSKASYNNSKKFTDKSSLTEFERHIQTIVQDWRS